MIGRSVTLLVALLLLAPGPVASQTTRVVVTVEGLRGDLKTNVEALLSIKAVEKTDVPVERLYSLHARAESEIRRALEPFGYYQPTIRSYLDKQGQPWTARYRVAPGPPIHVTEIDLQVRGPGVNEPGFQQAISEFPLKRGDILLHAAYESGKARFAATAVDSGYLDAVIDSAAIMLDLERYAATIVIHMTTGPQYFFGEVIFNQDFLDERVLRGYVKFEPGDPFRLRRLRETQANLNDGPYFSHVEAKLRRDLADSTTIPIEFELGARRTQRYEVGVGYGTDTGPRVTLDVELRRLNRYGHRAEGRAKVSLIENSISARYVIPGIYPNTWLTTFHVGFQQLDPQTSSSSRFVTGASAGHDRRGWRETFSLNYEIEAFTVGVDEGTSRLLMPQGDWTRLWSRDPIFTRRGARVRVNMFGSHEAVASTARFFQIKVEGKLIREPARRTRVILRGEVGRTITGKFRELPPTIRFFAGGDQSVRGFAFRTLSPKDEDGNPIGGPVLVVMSGELEYRFFEKWGVAAFYDAGNAFNEDLIGSPEALERAVGGGVRWLSPIGMFRADVGFPISAPEFDPWRFHLTIGPDL